MQQYLWYALWILLPIAPAFLLFKAVPKNVSTQKSASQGLEFKLVLSIGVYTLLVFLAHPDKLKFIAKQNSEWGLVTGFFDKNNNIIPISQISNVESVPAIGFKDLDGETVTINLNNVNINDGDIEIPYRVRVLFKDYEPIIISQKDFANKKDCEIDDKKKEIILKVFPAANKKYIDSITRKLKDTVENLEAKEKDIN